MNKQRGRLLRILAVIAVAVWLLSGNTIKALVDYLWFDALGYSAVYTTSLAARLGLWFVGAALTVLFIAGNLAFATREAPIDFRRAARLVLDRGLTGPQLRNAFRVGVGAWMALPALLFGATLSSAWMAVLTWLHRQPFGEVDPVFEKDLGFYIFSLPVYQHFQDALAALIAVTALPLLAFYFMRDVFVGQRDGLTRRARSHLLVLGALFFAVLAVGWHLESFQLLFEKSGVVYGMGYADLNGSLPAHWILIGVSLLSALALLVATRRRDWRLPTGAFALYGLSWGLLKGVWPSLLQTWMVTPNELDIETPFLEDNIAFTRKAFALDRIAAEPFAAESGLTAQDLDDNPETIKNIRVWDDGQLKTTYTQIQGIRPYYQFHDVDVDRYLIDGTLRQVMLSARELNYAKVENRSWVNEHFQYTHGHGVAMSPVNAVTDRGLPELFLQDIPTESNIDLQLDRPEIYYGELTNTYVFTATTTDEFDYPDGDENQYTRYAGTGGVPIGSLGKKLLFAAHFGSLDILLSNYLTSDSKVHFRRDIRSRVQSIAPFLMLDSDPYMVVVDGRLVWVLDAYTTSSSYPYSEPVLFRGAGGVRKVNYMRNAVKVVVDAYDGSVTFFVSDDADPVVQAYAAIFEGVFRPMTEMPAELQAHLRYPMDFFLVQAQVYARYHMERVGVFYNAEDLWDFASRSGTGTEVMGSQLRSNRPNYLIMKLPGKDQAEFVLLQPYVPKDKQNMIAWLAARSDGDTAGSLQLYQFPKQKLIFGPQQIEARINQDPEISKEMSLWDQKGSKVTRGSLLVIPVQDSLLYVMPLYLEAASSELPELKRVLVTYGDNIAMERTLEEALLAVFGQAGVPETTGDALPVVAQGGTSLGEVVQTLNTSWEAAMSAQRGGDWAAYGAALSTFEQQLAELTALTTDPTSEDTLAPTDPAPELAPDPAPEGAE